MPLFDYKCGSCNSEFEGLHKYDDAVPCKFCGASTKKLPTVAAFKITGHRAANGYGLNFIDTPSFNQQTGESSGYSFSGTKVDTKAIDYHDRA